MTLRQQLLKWIYPLIMLKGKLFPAARDIQVNTHHTLPNVPLYSLQAIAGNGAVIPLSRFKGKKLLVVNTASDCGYTRQYEELEKLYLQYKDKLEIIAFPANDFKGQEPGSDADIAQFCKINYGVSFIVMKKTTVTGAGQHHVFEWLSHDSQNGWCNQPPLWNFCKYLLDEEGRLTHFFSQTISPLSSQVLQAVNA
jgi:glutathione peroxidase